MWDREPWGQLSLHKQESKWFIICLNTATQLTTQIKSILDEKGVTYEAIYGDPKDPNNGGFTSFRLQDLKTEEEEYLRTKLEGLQDVMAETKKRISIVGRKTRSGRQYNPLYVWTLRRSFTADSPDGSAMIPGSTRKEVVTKIAIQQDDGTYLMMYLDEENRRDRVVMNLPKEGENEQIFYPREEGLPIRYVKTTTESKTPPPHQPRNPSRSDQRDSIDGASPVVDLAAEFEKLETSDPPSPPPSSSS